MQGWRHRNTTTVSSSSYDTGVGPDQPRSQQGWLTRTTTSPTTILICLSTRPLTSPESLWKRVISGAEVRILDQCLTDTALNVTLRALFAVVTLLHRTGSDLILEMTCGKRATASYTMAMLNTLHDTPTCSPVDDGSTDSQSNRSCVLGSIPALRIQLHSLDRDFSCPENGGGNQNHPPMGNQASDTLKDISNETGGEHGHCTNTKLHISDQVKRPRLPGNCLPDRDLKSKSVDSIKRVTPLALRTRSKSHQQHTATLIANEAPYQNLKGGPRI